MNSAEKNKKKFSEYTFEDIKKYFSDNLKKISSGIILLEIGNDFLNIGLAKSRNKRLQITKVFKQKLPKEAIEKSLPTDPFSFGVFLFSFHLITITSINRVALSLPSDACYTRLIEIPEDVEENDSISFLENPNSDIQIPISLGNSDFEVNLTNLPQQKKKNKFFNKYFLTSIPKKNIDIILESIKNANLKICTLQMSHMCIANLLKTEIDKIKDNDLIISVDLLDEFTQFVIFDASGPLFIKRLASIKNYPSIDDMKKINEKDIKKNNSSKMQKNVENYNSLSKLDLKILIREIDESFNNFLNKNNLNKKAKLFLSGRNSQHNNLVEILGESLKMDVSVISPINNYLVKEFSYNPDEINHFAMSRLVGLGLTLLKNNKLEDQNLNRDFLLKSFSSKDYKDLFNDKIEYSNNLNQVNIKLKDNAEAKTKNEEKKKELPPITKNGKLGSESINKNALDKEDKSKNQENKIEVKKNKSFKMDPSFLKND